MSCAYHLFYFFFFQAEDGIRDLTVTGVQTCALPISLQRQRQRGPGGHEGDKRAIERPLAVHRVERFGLGGRELHEARGADLEAGALEMGEDLAGLAGAHGVWLDDGEREHVRAR